MSANDHCDPGWNDPPKLSFNPESVSASKPRNVLNKRVPFSMNSTPPAGAQAPDPLTRLPPANMPPSVLPGINIDTHYRDNNQPRGSLDAGNPIDANQLDETIKLLNEILENNAELGRKRDDIRKRIDVMSAMWREGKLNADVQNNMLQIAKDLNDNPKSADELHKSLMIEHAHSVSSWMVGIKQLIFHCIAKCELLNIDKENCD